MSGFVVRNHRDAQPDFWFDPMLDLSTRARFHTFLAGYERRFAAGTHIKFDGDGSHSIYIVLSGWAALAKSLPGGQTQIIDFGIPGDFYSLVSADGETASMAYDAVTDARIAVVPISDWVTLEKSMPALSIIRERAAAAVRSRIAERMLRLGRGTAEQRLAYAFLELAIRCGAVHDNKIDCFHIPLSQQRLGDFMGLTSVHISRTLRRMKRHGAIGTSDHIDLCIEDIANLEELAGISVASLAREILPTI